MRGVILASLAGLVLLSACDVSPTPETQVKDTVKASLKDPDSAKFGDQITQCGTSTIYSGKVNAKNSYGGYNGFTDFYVDTKTGVVGLISDTDGPVFTLMEACTKAIESNLKALNTTSTKTAS